MKTKFFYLSEALMATIGFAACSSDDDNETAQINPVSLDIPTYADQAVHYTLPTPLSAKADEGPALSAIDFSESGRLLFELRDSQTGKLSYIMEKATANNGTYSIVDGKKARGTVKVVRNASARTRANEQIEVDVEVTIDGQSHSYDTGEEPLAVTSNKASSTDEATNHLCRSWNVLGAILDLKSKSKDIKAYEEFDSRNGVFYLEDVLKEAKDQDVAFSEDEEKEFQRQVTGITFTKSQLLIISYANHEDDVAEWAWANAEKTSITIKLKGEDMGNKFIQDGSRLNIAYNGNRCNVKISTKLNDNNNDDWEVDLTLKLQE